MINELVVRSAGGSPATLELFNPGGQPARVGGWYVSANRNPPFSFRLPSGSSVPAHGFLAVPLTALVPVIAGTALNYDGRGGELWILSADAAGALTGFSEGLAFNAVTPGQSLGRYTNSVGRILWLPQTQPSPGVVNGGPAVGPVILSEIQYHPATSEVEFVELKNISGAAVNLFDPSQPANTWRVQGTGFQFPPGVVLPPGGFAVVTAGDPDAFRKRFSIGASTPVLGPMPGNLQDNGERLILERPLPPESVLKADGSRETIVPFEAVDSVAYDSVAPWPLAAAGTGPSLERRTTDGLSDDPASWIASKGKGSPGTEGSGNTAPRVDAGSDQQIEALAYPVALTLKGSAADDGLPGGPLAYSWSQVDGPGPVSFSDPSAAAPVVQVPGQGTYTLRLTVSDGRLSASDDVILTTVRPPADAVFLPSGSVWRYLDDGSNAGTTWRSPDFNDSGWKSGKAQLGYSPDEGDEATVIGYGPDSANKFITSYFRTHFEIADARAVTSLTVRLLRDDGAVLFLNGQEVWRDNMPAGDYSYLTPASATVGGADESTFFERILDATVLKSGSNTLAVEVHQSSGQSSDVSFDLALIGGVTSVNRAPTASAGPARTLTLPAVLALHGSFSDDGLPNSPGVPAISWSRVSGPGVVGFSAANRLDTSATFSVAGRYVLRLTVNDGELSGTGDVTVDVVGGETPPAVGIVPGAIPALGFTTEADRSYTVQARDDLGAGTWSTVQQVTAGTAGRVIQVPLSGSGVRRFFRVVSPATP